MRRKDGSVNLDGLHQTVKDALPTMEQARTSALKLLLAGEMIVTSARDGKHGINSLHGDGLAVDLRTRDFTDAWAQYLRNALGAGWDVVVESDHIHVERDPKKRPLQELK